MVEPGTKQIELETKLRRLGDNIRILRNKTGMVSQIDGLITIPLHEDIEESVRRFLMNYSELFGIKIDFSDLKFVSKADGLGTIHFKYQQHHEEIPVLHAFISVHLNKEYKIIKIKINYYPEIPLDTKSILSRGVSKDKAFEIVNLLLDAEPKGIHHFLADLVIYPEDDTFYLAWEVRFSLKYPPESHHIYINVEDGCLLNRIDVLKRTDGKGRGQRAFNNAPD